MHLWIIVVNELSLSWKKNQTFSPFVIPRFLIVIHDDVCIYDMKVKVKLSLAQRDYLERKKKENRRMGKYAQHTLYTCRKTSKIIFF